MENNKFLQAQEAVDVSVLLKSVSDDLAFQMVVNLFTEAHKEYYELVEYFDYIWIEHGNGVRWEYAVEKHNGSQAQLCDLEKTLGTNIAFVGFTGFKAVYREEINIYGTFICEDNYLISKMKGSFYEGGKTYSERNYEP